MRTRTKKERQAISLRRDAIPRRALAKAAQRRILDLGLSRNEAAKVAGDAASQMSRLMTGHITDFSADRLAKILTRTGVNVTILLSVNGRTRGKRGDVQVLDWDGKAL